MRPTWLFGVAVLALCCPAAPALAQSQLLGNEPKILAMTQGNWVHFRDYNGRQLIYFTHLEAYRCGIAVVRYSINTDALDKVWPLQPCDPNKPHNITTTKPYLSLPPGAARSITVQLSYHDGTQSAIVRQTP